MFNIDYIITNFGIQISLKGRICRHDLIPHIEELKNLSHKISNPEFGVLLDFSEVISPICSDTARLLDLGRIFLIGRGAKRIVILYNSNSQIVDLTRVFGETDIYERERYISTMIHPNAIVNAIRYLKEGIEPWSLN